MIAKKSFNKYELNYYFKFLKDVLGAKFSSLLEPWLRAHSHLQTLPPNEQLLTHSISQRTTSAATDGRTRAGNFSLHQTQLHVYLDEL